MPNKPFAVSIGQVFSKLTVLERVSASRSGTRYLCHCECGRETTVFSAHLVRGNTKSCGCALPRGPTHKQWTGHGEISGNFFNQIKRSAAGAKGGRRTRPTIHFDLTIEYLWDLFLQQGRKCAMTGLPLTFARRYANSRAEPQTASLDRIDSGGDYVPANVQWVHKDVNRMKNVFTQDRFLEICRLVAATHPTGGACSI